MNINGKKNLTQKAEGQNKNPSAHQLESAPKRSPPSSPQGSGGSFTNLRERLVRVLSGSNINPAETPANSKFNHQLLVGFAKIVAENNKKQQGKLIAQMLSKIQPPSKADSKRGTSIESCIKEPLKAYLDQASLDDVFVLRTKLNDFKVNTRAEQKNTIAVFDSLIHEHLIGLLKASQPLVFAEQSLSPRLIEKLLDLVCQSDDALRKSEKFPTETKASMSSPAQSDVAPNFWKDLHRAKFQYRDEENQLKPLYESPSHAAESNSIDKRKNEAVRVLARLAGNDSRLLMRTSNQAQQGVLASFIHVLQNELDSPLKLKQSTLCMSTEESLVLLPAGTSGLFAQSSTHVNYVVKRNDEQGMALQAEFFQDQSHAYAPRLEEDMHLIALNPAGSFIKLAITLQIPKAGAITLEKATYAYGLDFFQR